jgi:D-xylonolactonase
MPCELGENPLWHPVEQQLYWTDILRGRIYRYDPETRIHEEIYCGRPVGGFTFQAGGGVLLFMDRGGIAIWRNGSVLQLLEEIPAERESRFNDVIADPTGRVFCGTMPSAHEKGRLYRLDVDGTLRVILSGVACSNGLTFGREGRSFFYTDSFRGEIYRFKYSALTGEITERKVFASFPAAEGLPDGLTIDTDGCLWSALWDGGCVVRLSPQGVVIDRVAMPTPKTSSLSFGGQHFDETYITTAGGAHRNAEDPHAGALFSCLAGVRGFKENFSQIPDQTIRIAS